MGLDQAFVAGRILPGMTLYLRGGVYTGAFVSSLVGVAVQPYGMEKPVIDGSLSINGSDCSYDGIEVLNSAWTTRISAQSGSNPSDLPIAGSAGSGIDVFGARTIVRNCIVHDCRQGIGLWAGAIGATLDGCLTYNNGWNGPDRNHGHQLYTQNQQPTKTISNCVFAGGYSDWALHAYTEGGYVQQYALTGNIMIGKLNIFQGGAHGIDGIICDGNVLWGGALAFGTPGSINGSVSALNTEALGGAQIAHAGSYTSYSESGTNTTLGNRILTRGRFVAVCNQANAASVPAPKAGRYTNAQNVAESITLNAGDPLPMDIWTVATPIAAAASLAQWDSRFGVFLVEAL